MSSFSYFCNVRESYKYQVDLPKDFICKLFSFSRKKNYSSILLSNHSNKQHLFPKDYINYDVVAGIGMLKKITSNKNSFQKLKEFHIKYSDWIFGYLSYDLKNELENISSNNQDRINADNLCFFIPEHVFLLKGNTLEVLTFHSKNEVDILIQGLVPLKQKELDKICLLQKEDQKAYLNNVKKIKEHIQRGDIYEMNYCLEYFAKDVELDPEELFLSLNEKTNTPFAGFVHIDKQYILSASPERFLRKKKTNIISQPIKGTIKRGENSIEDKKLKLKLKHSEKDISENVMITDLVRNDLSITALRSSVKVDEFCEVYPFEGVYQMISTISSQVDEELHFTEIMSSAFPMGSMTGAPKIRAMELIEKYEIFRRGIFSGSIGYITPEGDFDFNVIIRTILYNSNKKYLSVGVGGAITINSEEHKEYEECLLKIKPIFDILDH